LSDDRQKIYKFLSLGIKISMVVEHNRGKTKNRGRTHCSVLFGRRFESVVRPAEGICCCLVTGIRYLSVSCGQQWAHVRIWRPAEDINLFRAASRGHVLLSGEWQKISVCLKRPAEGIYYCLTTGRRYLFVSCEGPKASAHPVVSARRKAVPLLTNFWSGEKLLHSQKALLPRFVLFWAPCEAVRCAETGF